MKSPWLGLRVPPKDIHPRGAALVRLPRLSITHSPNPCPTRMRKDEPHTANSLQESISLLDRARSPGSLRMGDYPAILWYDPYLLHKTPPWIKRNTRIQMLCPHWVCSYSAPLPHWTFNYTNKALPNALVMVTSFLRQKKTKINILQHGD